LYAIGYDRAMLMAGYTTKMPENLHHDLPGSRKVSDVRSKEDILKLSSVSHDPIIVFADSLNFTLKDAVSLIRGAMKITRPIIFFSEKKDVPRKTKEELRHDGDISFVGPNDSGSNGERGQKLLAVAVEETSLREMQKWVGELNSRVPGLCLRLTKVKNRTRVEIENGKREFRPKEFLIIALLLEKYPHGARFQEVLDTVFEKSGSMNSLATFVSRINQIIFPFRIVSKKSYGYFLKSGSTGGDSAQGE
jgi:hypothetical protein